MVYVYFITTANIQKVFDFVYMNTFFYALFLMIIKKTLSLQHNSLK
nr:MAG TPA: hypothetical protein [Microviridae sp.]